ncbi:MAG: glycoside hydrolase [Actinomycetota bacterium]|nr:glycoside hydrolase [Actinomycetota bacterium]
MKRLDSWSVVLVTAALIVVVVGSAFAFDVTSVRASLALDPHQHSPHAQPLIPLGLEWADSSFRESTALPGAEVVSHFAGGRDASRRVGAGSRMIYTGTSAIEPTLGFDKEGNLFFQGARLGELPIPIVVVSRDQGRSWDDVTPPTHTHTRDPMLYVDPRTSRVFVADLTHVACTTVSHSDDVGQSWITSEACGLTDHQNVFAGPSVFSPTIGYPQVVYLCAIDGGTLVWASTATSCLKSLDGGITWTRTGAPAYTDDPRQGAGDFGIPGACGGGAGHGVVDSKGIIYLPRGWCEQPYLAISKDEGATWERIQVADIGMPQGRDWTGRYWDHEAAVAVDTKGNIYYFWVAHDRLPYLAISSDGGNTFAKPMMIGSPGLKEAWGPKIEVGDVGKVALAYVGSTTAPGGKSPTGVGPKYDPKAVSWNGYITTSLDVLSKRPRFFTASVNHPSDPIMRGECAVTTCGVQFDFIDVVIGPDGRPWASMVDGCPPPGKPCDAYPGLGFVGTVVGGSKLR